MLPFRQTLVRAAAALLLQVVLYVHAAAPRTLVNPSFENANGARVQGWSFWNWARKGQRPSHVGMRDETVARDGRASLCIRGTEPTQVGCWDNKHADALIPVTPGANYEMSVWVRLETVAGEGVVDRLSLGFYDADKEALPESAERCRGKLTGTLDWTRLSVLAQAPENAAFARIDLAFTGVGAAWFDDVALVPVRSLAAEADDPGCLQPFLRAAVAPTPPTIDGRDEEGLWTNALHTHPFLLADGSAYPEERTEMALAADASVLYLWIVCSEALLDPVLQRTHEVVAKATDRDGAVLRDDHVEVLLQSTAIAGGLARIAVNPRGALYDSWTRAGDEDVAWSSDATATVTTEAKRWCVELAIPFDALGGVPAPGTALQMNVSRYRSADKTTSSWTPQTAGARPAPVLGAISFGAPRVGVRDQAPLLFEEGTEYWQLQLESETDLAATTLLRYDDHPWNATTTTLPRQATSAVKRVPYTLRQANAAILLDAPPAQAHRTLCFRTDRLPVRGDMVYRFQARVRTEEVVAGKGRPISLAISSYGSDDKPIKSYEILASAPSGTGDWQTIEATWQSPRQAASILFWGVKWGGSGASGKVWLDDLNLCPLGSLENVLPNGGVALTEDGTVTDWNLFSGASKADSYERGARVRAVCELRTADGALLLRSAPVPGTVTPRITAIDAALLLKAGMKDSDSVVRYKELYVTEGGILALPVALRSSFAERHEWADLLLDVPRFLHLVDPSPRAQILERNRDADRRRYRVRFGGDMVSPAAGDRHSLKVEMLVLECGTMGQQSPLEISIGSAVRDAQGETRTFPLNVLPPLRWRRPEVALIKNWACGSYYRDFRRLNDRERDAIARYWRQAGFNRTGAALETTLRERYGFSARGHIPLITAPANGFPGGMEYLAEHPEAHAMRFSGEILKNTFCPTYFLSTQNTHLPAAREWLAEHARRYPHLDWDYEVPVTRDTSICVCERCVNAFCKAKELPTDGSVIRANIRDHHRKEWIDWRCRENARIGQFFREEIKKANPECLFSIYSGYQGTTDDKYGVDWRYMSRPADLVWAGYGRPVQAVVDTHAAIGDKPLICGTLAWFGTHPWDNRRAQVDLFRRLTDGGSGIMTYFNWIVDGRFYQAVNRVASVVADFEHFFRWDIDGKGDYHSRYQRGDQLLQVVEGGDAADVTVLLRGDERLVFALNHSAEERVLHLIHKDWQDGMVCLDAESRELQGQSHKVALPPRDVRIFHVRTERRASVAAPRLLAGITVEPSRQPAAAWQGMGRHPGDQAFELQISTSDVFTPDTTQVVENLSVTAFLPGDLRPGTPYWWRVRARDVPSGEQGPWSRPGGFLRGAFEEGPGAIPAFSPNGDGILDTVVVRAELAESMPWTLRILDGKGQEVKTVPGAGDQVSATWDGTNAQGERVPEGTYRYVVVPGERADLAAGGSVELNLRAGLQNPGFRDCVGFVLTVATGTGRHTRDYAVSLSDSYSLRLDASAPGTTVYWSNYASGGVGSSVIPVRPGTDYRFATRVRTELAVGEATIALAFFTADGRWAQVEGRPPSGVTADPVVGSTTGWEEREIVLTVPDDALSAVLFFRMKDAQGKAWFDQVEAGVRE